MARRYRAGRGRWSRDARIQRTPPVRPAASSDQAASEDGQCAQPLRGALVVRGPEAGAAAAGGDRVRVVHREAGTHERVDVVDLRALQQVHALAVDVDLDAAGLEDVVLGRRRVLEHHPVAEAGAPAGVDVHAQADAGLVSSLVSSRSFEAAASVRDTTVGCWSIMLLERVLLGVRGPHRTHVNGFRQALAPKSSGHGGQYTRAVRMLRTILAAVLLVVLLPALVVANARSGRSGPCSTTHASRRRSGARLDTPAVERSWPTASRRRSSIGCDRTRRPLASWRRSPRARSRTPTATADRAALRGPHRASPCATRRSGRPGTTSSRAVHGVLSAPATGDQGSVAIRGANVVLDTAGSSIGSPTASTRASRRRLVDRAATGSRTIVIGRGRRAPDRPAGAELLRALQFLLPLAVAGRR